MTTFVSGSYFTRVQAAMLRLCAGLVLAGSAVAVHAAQPEGDPFAPGFDLLTIQVTRYDIVQPDPYRFSAKTGISDIAYGRAGFGGAASLPEYFDLKKVTDWVASIRWHLTADSDRASLSPHLRVESRETLLEIKPLEQSVWMVWRRSLD